MHSYFYISCEKAGLLHIISVEHKDFVGTWFPGSRHYPTLSNVVMAEGVIVSENDDKLRICEMNHKMCETDLIVALHSQVTLHNLENLKNELILSEFFLEKQM